MIKTTLGVVVALVGMAIVSLRAGDVPSSGSLSIQSPVACRISIPALKVSGEKPLDRLQLPSVPVGTYTATFSGFNREFSHTFAIVAGRATRLTVNLGQGKVTEGEAAVTGAARPATTPRAAADPLLGPSFVIPELGVTMVAVNPGAFVMGNDVTTKNETPATRVTITRRYWLSRTEVTQAQWMALMETNPSRVQGAEQPVESITWQDAMSYCQRLTQHERQAGRIPEGAFYILPLQAQWEYAARAGGDGNREDELASLGWYQENSGNRAHPAGRRPANAWGLQDMRGNVAEWCFDWMGAYPGGATADYAGPGEGTQRVVRGGAYDFPAFTCRASARIGVLPESVHGNVGFRLALMLLPPKAK